MSEELKRYNVNAKISITMDVICEFVDDGSKSLEALAREAAMEYSDLPYSLHDQVEIDNITLEEL